MSGPAAFYANIAERACARAVALSRASRALSLVRLVVFCAGALALFAGLHLASAGVAGLSLPCAAGFVVLVLRHETVERERSRVSRRIERARAGLRRLAGRWHGDGTKSWPAGQHDHPYAADLDLFGPDSLFQLMCRATTQDGREQLAAWLGQDNVDGQLSERQAAVRELAQQPELLVELESCAETVGERVDSRRLRAWALAPCKRMSRARVMAAVGFPVAFVTAMVAWLAEGRSGWWVLAVLAGLFGLHRSVAAQVRELDRDLLGRTRDLELIAQLARLACSQTWSCPHLARVCARLRVDGRAIESPVSSLRRRVECFEARKNGLFAILSYPLAWEVHCVRALEAWHLRWGARVRDWLDALAEFEALSSLAQFCFDHPSFVFAQVDETSKTLNIENMGHPLIPADDRVCNDVELAGEKPDLIVLSGSNMAGKSTYLRAIGINVALARAGAPVCATAMRLPTLRLGVSVRALDSLSGGRSRFRAELEALAKIVELARERNEAPVLFLFDELFHGTNSRDRRRGAQALLRKLIELGAVGVVTTHDLELTRMVEALPGRVVNRHMRDVIVDGEMQFDYRVRDGIVPGSNALALLRMVGILDADEARELASPSPRDAPRDGPRHAPRDA